MRTHSHPSVTKGAELVWENREHVTVVDVFPDRAPGWTRVAVQPSETVGREFVSPVWFDLDEVIAKCGLELKNPLLPRASA